MKRFYKFVIPLVTIIGLCVPSLFALEDDEYYTAYNLWYEHPEKMWSINYKRGQVIPAGSKVQLVSGRGRGGGEFYRTLRNKRGHGNDKRSRDRGRRRPIRLEVIDSEMEITIYFTPKFHPGLTKDEFVKRLLTKSTLEELTAGMTHQEKSCIERAVVEVGISKKATLIALGYPPEHFTASTDSSRWYFWTSRMVKKIIDFSDDKATVGLESSPRIP
jgi:hypothetical protein